MATTTSGTARESQRRFRSKDQGANRMQVLSDILGREIDVTQAQISAQAAGLADKALRLDEIAKALSKTVGSVIEMLEVSSGHVETFAAAATELEASNIELSHLIGSASTLSSAALGHIDSTSAQVVSLKEAANAINGVVGVIEGIAGQTRMLSLNATIEAVRAGDLGKGFGVVADEVKGLSRATEAEIQSISAMSLGIEQATDRTATMVHDASSAVSQILDAASHAHAATDDQLRASSEVAITANAAKEALSEITLHSGSILDQLVLTDDAADSVRIASKNLSEEAGNLGIRLASLFRQIHLGETPCPRKAFVSGCTLRCGGQVYTGFTYDLSPISVLIDAAVGANCVGQGGELEIIGFGSFLVKVEATSTLGTHLSFNLGATVAARLAEALAQARRDDDHYSSIAMETALRVESTFAKALQQGVISNEKLFSEQYVPIHDSDPHQVMAEHTAFTDSALPAIMEPILSSDRRVTFCVAVDRNGYIATHNRAYSQPQQSGNREWNTSNSRNRRIFDDKTGIFAARNTEPIRIQTYPRQINSTTVVVCKEYNSPIRSSGRLWGNIRLAVLPKEW